MSLSSYHPEQIAKICGGSWLHGHLPDFPLHRTVIDSRQMRAHTLFIALKGSQTDGHEFLKLLDNAPLQAAMVERPEQNITLPQLIVRDVEAGFQALAQAICQTSPAKKIAITGSVGKTGIKEMIAKMLEVAGTVHATSGNLNNHLGLPLTVTSMPEQTDFLVTEMGMNNAGEIARLSEIVRPHIAIITRISNAHAGFFDSLSDIAEAKAEIFSGADSSAIAILPRDDEFYGQLAGSARLCGVKTILSFGQHPDSTVRLESLKQQSDSLLIEASLPAPDKQGARTHFRFTLGMHAKHYAVNALCALTAGYALGLNIESLLPAFAEMREAEGRGRLHKLTHAGREIRLIDDSYNASPASMLAALEAVKTAKAVHSTVILSDMLELGEAAESEHLNLIPAIIAADIQTVISAGPMMEKCCKELPSTITRICHQTADLLKAYLEENLDQILSTTDLILVKGSHGSGAHKISQYLIHRLNEKHNGPATPTGGVFHAA